MEALLHWLEALSRGSKTKPQVAFHTHKVSFLGMFSLILSFLDISHYISKLYMKKLSPFIHAPNQYFIETFYMTISI